MRGTGRKTAKSASLFCAVIHICSRLTESPHTFLLALLFCTEEAKLVGSVAELNGDRDKFHKGCALTDCVSPQAVKGPVIRLLVSLLSSSALPTCFHQ